MDEVRAFLRGVSQIHETGEAVEETSYYGQLESLLNAVGTQLSPTVFCVLTTKNRGAGVPDGGLFLASPAVVQAGPDAMLGRHPERGAVEAKGPAKDVGQIALTKQVRDYLTKYGKVLVTTYREFLVVNLDSDGNPALGERYALAATEANFWALAKQGHLETPDVEAGFVDFLKRALTGDAPLTQPADLAWFLAAYAREAKRRLDEADPSQREGLSALRSAFEESLGLTFDELEGEAFFRSALVQTLFYGVFAAWVVWSDATPLASDDEFDWHTAQWTLNVPMVRVLYHQLASPSTLPVGLNDVLDWTQDTLNRVDRQRFFVNFEAANAVQYFYEPFLKAYDPDLRRELGVWYTPPEIVRYMVGRVNKTLKEEFGLPLGLADSNVHILDPCTGTGSFLVETIRVVEMELKAHSADALIANDVKEAVLKRIHGFELLPAPFVIAHLNVGLALDQVGATLVSSSTGGERANIFLTNALTGWDAEPAELMLAFPEFAQERDAAVKVKQQDPILVVIGNPPYNGFAGVSGTDEGDLVKPYKEGLNATWDITKNKLDDLYVRFIRVAERRIAERTRRGIVCYISNFGWLSDPSAVVMRQHLLGAFDSIYIDNLNGDSRETGKKTPDGLSDPSVFSTRLSPQGIQVGTAVSLFVRADAREPSGMAVVRYREFWGQNKRTELEAAVDTGYESGHGQELTPNKKNWYRLRPWDPRQGYDSWPSLIELAGDEPALGLVENRGDALVDHDRDALSARIAHYADPALDMTALTHGAERLAYNWARFDPAATRTRVLQNGTPDLEKIRRYQVRPFDARWAYVDSTPRLWNEPRTEYVGIVDGTTEFLIARRRAPRFLDGCPFIRSSYLVDQHALHKDAYAIPYVLPPAAANTVEDDDGYQLFAVEPASVATETWRPNLSEMACSYLDGLEVRDYRQWMPSAKLIWHHVMAVGYSPLYVDENNDAIRSNWPRIPLPNNAADLSASAELGERVGDLLDLGTPLIGTSAPLGGRGDMIARIVRVDGGQLSPTSGDLDISVGWATLQIRTQTSGAVSRVVMPGSGRFEIRSRMHTEANGFSDDELDLLGPDVIDVYLNNEVCWAAVPEAVWDFKIGGFQVLRKWLSYRERVILGRSATVEEVREFSGICRRLTELVLLGPRLDDNYVAVADEGLTLWEDDDTAEC